MRNSIWRSRAAFAGLSLLLSACNQQLPAWDAGKLVVIMPETAQSARAQFERELAQLFAEQLQVTLETITIPQDETASALQRHQAHLAAVSLRRETDMAALQFAPSYQNVRELVVCNHDHPPPRKLADLSAKRFAAVAGSDQEATLREARENMPSLQWQARQNLTQAELLAEVAAGALDCAAVNELQLADAHNYHPNLIEALEIATPSRLAWGFPGDADPELLSQARIFFTRIRQDGTLNRLLDRYYGHNHRLDKMDAAAFIANVKTTLPHYRRLFEEAASITGEDWRLLAALAYQESQWDPLASSPTNVRGMMMLTEDTADRMSVSNRLDARESILAGAQYLALLKKQMPERIPEPDRTWMALAAYNQGYGHLEDARILTLRAGLDPDSWSDIKKWMPKLNQPGYYETLKRGYARGGEAVILVESIRNYYDMLKRLEPGPASIDSESISYRLIKPLKRLLR
ncbi:MAG: membrane-bound lytic murein transglycosylase MltF [Nitrosomonadales bacterium]|nr:membrane-bound lytic murein transglycosylase MltF [Nitrosomonadales bacterium]